jgi:hypothetical protein
LDLEEIEPLNSSFVQKINNMSHLTEYSIKEDEVVPFNESHITKMSASEIFNHGNPENQLSSIHGALESSKTQVVHTETTQRGKFLKPEQDQLVTSLKKRHVKFSIEAPENPNDREK